MHTSHRNVKYNYTIQRQIMIKVAEEKCVIVTSDLKCAAQCSAASRKGCIILGFIARNFYCKSPEVITRLYSALVRQHLHYVVRFWSLLFSKGH